MGTKAKQVDDREKKRALELAIANLGMLEQRFTEAGMSKHAEEVSLLRKKYQGEK